ncbi:MAG: alpha-hydroxy acid oxidase [Chloroflexi bacterium]|nr:alpha-hydroxy acid oxidase [Chloroflexota bacterium]MDA1227032.1 alpha-hydroxy acid oxidase [Chloroflexota bacterium]
MMSLDFVTNEEVIQAARARLPQSAWDYLSGASESETTMRRNRLAFDKVAFRPRVLVDVSSVDPSTTFLGHKLRIPVMPAPVGSLQEFTPEGGAATTKACAEFGTMHVVSSVTEPSLEAIAESGDNPKVFQLYVHGDWEWTKDLIDRAKAAGYVGLCTTVDTAHYSRRERPLRGRWEPPTRRVTRDPFWSASVTWDSIDKYKAHSGLPYMLKGIATAEDAKIAVDHGVDVIWVSNHGGRQLDHGLGTMDMLPEIVEAVDGRAEIVLDGGIQRGSDVVKAAAMGVKAVAIGKLQCWGLGAAGKDGLVRVLEILEEEMIVAMALMGVTSLDQLNSNYVTKADLVTMPHEMSTWVNKPVDRIL